MKAHAQASAPHGGRAGLVGVFNWDELQEAICAPGLNKPGERHTHVCVAGDVCIYTHTCEDGECLAMRIVVACSHPRMHAPASGNRM